MQTPTSCCPYPRLKEREGQRQRETEGEDFFSDIQKHDCRKQDLQDLNPGGCWGMLTLGNNKAL